MTWVGHDLPWAARVSASGKVLDPNRLALPRTTLDPGAPEVVYGGSTYLSVLCSASSTSDVSGVRVTSDGQILDPSGFAIATGSALQTNPTAAWDHNVFETVWNESPDSISTYDLRGARVTSDATVLDPSGFDITTTPISEFAPDATAGQSGRAAVAYLRTNGGADQVALRFLDRGPVASTGIGQASDWFAFLHGTVNPNNQRILEPGSSGGLLRRSETRRRFRSLFP